MKKLLVLGLLFCSINTFAQSDPQKIIDEFFNLYKSKGSDASLDYLFGTNKWMIDSKDQIENIKFKINTSVAKTMGTFYGQDLITKKTIGENLTFYTYLLRYERQPIRFSFLLYNPNGQWRLQNFSFDDGLKAELEEGAKAYRLKENLEY